MIIYFGPGGRLGNLLFQWAYLDKIRRPRERILTIGMGALRSFLRLPNYLKDYSSSFAIGVEKKLLKPFFVQLLVRFRIITSFYEHDGRVVEMKGFFRSIRYVHGYFQAETIDPNAVARWKIRAKWSNRAKELTAAYEGKRFFVHVRLTDYQNVVIWGIRDACLPLSYYTQAWSLVSSSLEDSWLFVFSDDPDRVRPVFANYPKVVFWSNPAEVDLLLMASCGGGILSNSTFSFWAAYLSTRTLPMIAPRFWMGYKSQKVYPPGFKTPFAQEMDVPYEEA